MIIQTIKNYSRMLFSSWTNEEQNTFISLLEKKSGCSFIDLGAGDGKLTTRFSKACKASKIIAVDSSSLKKKIKNKSISFVSANLNKKLPFVSNSFDVVVSHFSLEHLYNTGLFLQEIRRILKKGAYAVIATDNLSTWPNVISLIMGWQPTSTAYGVVDKPLGNPFALKGDFVVENTQELGELSHNKVLAYKMLLDACKEYGYKIEKVKAVGYFPLFGKLSKFFCKIDKRHGHWIILKVRKV